MKSALLDELLEKLLQKYEYMLGKKNNKNMSFEKIIQAIITYHEDIISAMPGNVYWFDKNCIAVGCNKNVLKMVKLKSVKQFKGLTFEQLGKIGNWTKEAEISFKKDTTEVIRTGKPKYNVKEPPIPYHDGRRVYFLSSRVPLFDQKKRVVGVIGISVDITEIKNLQDSLVKAKEAAEEANQAKTEFIQSMSHDIRTPLTGMGGATEMLLQRLQDPELRKITQNISNASKQLLSLLNEIMESASAKHHKFKQKPFQLSEIFTKLEELLTPSLMTKNLSFKTEIDQNIPKWIKSKPQALHRILLNILGNALKFTHAGNITLGAKLLKIEKEILWLQFTIADTGIGMPEEKAHLIFEPFVRLHDNKKYAGSGFGLHLVKEFVDNLGGTITVKSKLHQGTVFTINLPFLKVKNPPKIKNLLCKVTPIYSVPPIFNFAPKLLVIEDDELSSTVLINRLKIAGCEVTLATDGQEAINYFKHHSCDFIYTDIGLPDIKGYEAVKIIREIEKKQKRKRIPIIGISAHAKETEKDKCLESGMDMLMTKGISIEELYQNLQFFLGDAFKLSTDALTKKEMYIQEYREQLKKYILDHYSFIQETYQKQDWPTLYDAAHKLYGGMSFCNLPSLSNATYEFVAAVAKFRRGKLNDINDIKILYAAFEKEIEKFLKQNL